jgi:hypothetical protein
MMANYVKNQKSRHFDLLAWQMATLFFYFFMASEPQHIEK